MRDLAAGPRRFVELQRVLPGISTEQLRSRLNRMVTDGLLTRKRFREVPPRVDYELTYRAYELMPVLGELAQWGYEWAWSGPRGSESVDIAAIFRLAGGIVKPAPGIEGVVELRINGADDAPDMTYSVTLLDGRVTAEERPADQAAARVSGDVGDWIAALAPDHDRGGLAITGDRKLASELLDGLSGSKPLAERTQRSASAA